MQLAYTCVGIIMIGIMVIKMPSSEATMNCPLYQDIAEMKRYYEAIKDVLQKNDKITQISLLRASTLNQIPKSDRCCFLLKLGTFYVTNIFPQLDLTISQLHREFSHLANALLGLKIELKHCHATMRCPCGEQAHTAMEEFKEDYYKMNTQDATFKAIGELNVLFHWIEKKFKS